MGIPVSAFGGAFDALPDKPTIAPEIDAPNKAAQGEEKAGSYVVRRGFEGFGKGAGQTWQALHLRDEGMKTLLRAFLPKSIGETFYPSLFKDPTKAENLNDVPEVMGGRGAQLGGKVANVLPGVEKGSTAEKVGPAPGPISESFGNMADFVGQGLSLPMPGTYGTKGLLSLAGASLGAEAFGVSGEALARNVFGASDETAKGVRAGAGLLGSVVGAPANVVRGNAVMAPVKGGANAAKAAFNATKDTFMRKPNDPRNWTEMFDDYFKTLGAKTTSKLKDTVFEQVAKDISLDPHAEDAAKAFNDAARRAGANVDDFNIAQKATTPSLVATVKDMIPRTPEDVRKLTQQDQKSRAEVLRVFNDLTKRTVKPDAESVVKDLKALQTQQEAIVTSKNKLANEVAAEAPRLTAQERFTQGQELLDNVEGAYKASTEAKNAKYNAAADLAEQAGQRYDTTELIGRAKTILGDTLSKLDPATSPDVIARLKNVFTKGTTGKGADFNKVVEGMPDDVKAWFQSDYATGKAPGASLRDLYDAKAAIGTELDKIRTATDSQAATQRNNLNSMREELTKIIDTQTNSPEVLKAHGEAERFFKEAHKDRFGGDLNKKVVATTRAFPGQERVDPIALIDNFVHKENLTKTVSETNMREFDKLFGGVVEGSQRNERAYQILGRHMEDKFADEVLKGGPEGLKPEAFKDFVRKNEAALLRVPETGQKLMSMVERIDELNNEAKRVSDNFKKIIGSDLTATLGAKNADQLVAQAVSSPEKMVALIRSFNKLDPGAGRGAKTIIKEVMNRARPWKEGVDGMEYDAEKLLKLVNDGGGTIDKPGGLRVAFRAAFGPKEGDQHLQNLRDIALLAQRQALTSPKFLRPQEPFPPDILKYKTGQSGASIITSYKAMEEGRVSPTWFVTQWASRYGNMKIGQAFNKMQQEALFDPEAAKTILSMADTMRQERTITESAGRKLAAKAGKEGAQWLRDLIEADAFAKHAARGAAVGLKNLGDEEEDKKRQSYRTEHWSVK